MSVNGITDTQNETVFRHKKLNATGNAHIAEIMPVSETQMRAFFHMWSLNLI